MANGDILDTKLADKTKLQQLMEGADPIGAEDWLTAAGVKAGVGKWEGVSGIDFLDTLAGGFGIPTTNSSQNQKLRQLQAPWMNLLEKVNQGKAAQALEKSQYPSLEEVMQHGVSPLPSQKQSFTPQGPGPGVMSELGPSTVPSAPSLTPPSGMNMPSRLGLPGLSQMGPPTPLMGMTEAPMESRSAVLDPQQKATAGQAAEYGARTSLLGKPSARTHTTDAELKQMYASLEAKALLEPLSPQEDALRQSLKPLYRYGKEADPASEEFKLLQQRMALMEQRTGLTEQQKISEEKERPGKMALREAQKDSALASAKFTNEKIKYLPLQEKRAMILEHMAAMRDVNQQLMYLAWIRTNADIDNETRDAIDKAIAEEGGATIGLKRSLIERVGDYWRALPPSEVPENVEPRPAMKIPSSEKKALSPKASELLKKHGYTP